MKKRTFENIEVNGNKKGVEMFIQTLEEMLFYYSYESYKLPALNSHFLCLDLLSTAESIKEKELTEGNIIPLCEEFEYVIERDYALSLLFDTKVLLKKQDSTGRIISLTKMDTKAKGNQYPSIAKYINDVCITDFAYINVIISELEKLLFLDEYELNELNKIYMLTRALVSDLVNGGYSPEHIRYQTKKFFGEEREKTRIDQEFIQSFFSLFPFNRNHYKVVLVVNTEAARILKAIDTFSVYLPKQEIKNKLNIRHANDSVVEVEIESLDAYGAIKEACDVISVVLSLHKISQHHTNCYIRKNVLCFMIEDEDITETIKWTTDHNILLRAKNESKLQSAFFNEQLVKNISATDTFYKAVRLHNSALDSKDSSNQLLDLWTAVETMVDFKTGSRDKISVICDVLINVLVRSYLYNRVEQLLNDIHNIIGDKVDELLQTGERATTAFAKILSVPENHDIYNEVYSLLDEAPLLQYRMELFNKEIFVNSKSIYEELRRHENRLKWQIMRIYRNRNMIVHNGDYMPYIDVILGNLHYYLDMMYDVLIEYYHLGWTDNQDIFYRLEKERLDHYIKLGVTESGVIKNPVAIMEENYKELLFNGFEGNVIKNIVKDISNGHNK